MVREDDEGPAIATENETRSTRKYNWMEMDGQMARTLDIATLRITPAVLSSIAELDKFKGAWRAIGRIAPDRLFRLRHVATIESIGSSTRIEGAKLSNMTTWDAIAALPKRELLLCDVCI